MNPTAQRLLLPAVAAAAGIALVGGYLWFSRAEPKEAPPAPIAAPASPPAAGDAALPPPEQSDAHIREGLAGVSSDPLFASWLKQEGLLERLVTAVSNLDEGASPRKALPFLAPAEPFTADSAHGKQVMSAASAARYDKFADAIASVDAGKAAAAVRALSPLLDAGYRALGYPDRHFDDAVRRALQRIVDAPVPQGAIVLHGKRGIYTFDDPKLEAQKPVEKHLIRLGESNQRKLQSKARELLQQLAPASAAPTAQAK